MATQGIPEFLNVNSFAVAHSVRYCKITDPHRSFAGRGSLLHVAHWCPRFYGNANTSGFRNVAQRRTSALSLLEDT